jgi:hypothetical protein
LLPVSLSAGGAIATFALRPRSADAIIAAGTNAAGTYLPGPAIGSGTAGKYRIGAQRTFIVRQIGYKKTGNYNQQTHHKLKKRRTFFQIYFHNII